MYLKCGIYVIILKSRCLCCRRSLWKYHDYLFTFDEDYDWTFEKMPNLVDDSARGVKLGASK